MPLSLRRGTVTAVVERFDGLDRIEVDGEACISYPRTTGAVELGDEVLVNVQAVELGLGSGGFHVLYANLTRGLGLDPEPGAHVMTLPYSPVQQAVHFVEEEGELAATLGGMPVVCCSLHSQVAPAVAGVGKGVRVAYVQLPGGALPVSLSDSLRALKERALVEVAVAAGACFDGDAQAVSVSSALAWVAAEGFDVAVCGVGPGIVGTGSSLGHGGVAAADAANVVSALSGSPVLTVRVSQGDSRERHRGVSHHTRAVVGLVLGDVVVAWPAGLEAPSWLSTRREVDVTGWQDACEGLILDHMGRGPDDDPWFFASAFAAGRLARGLLG
jgi:3-dehydroquinate dehydratase